MKEHPILFSGPMVRAILDGRKTQTRRPAKVNGPDDRPPWQAGDRLWVRETFNRAYDQVKGEECFLYRADGADHPLIKWTPSIHMPRKACRLFLEVEEVTSQYLQDITFHEVLAEGFLSRKAFFEEWRKMYPGKIRKTSMAWVIKFHPVGEVEYE